MSSIIRVEKNADNPYAVIDKRFLSRPDLSARAKVLLALLLSKCNHWTATVGGLLAEMQEGRAFVAAGLRDLEKAGYLTRRRVRAAGGHFGWESVVTETPTQQKVRFQQNTPEAGLRPMVERPTVQPPAVNLPVISNEEVNNESKKAKPAEASSWDLPSDWPAPLRAAWGDFVLHRREKKKPLTATSVKLLLAKLQKWGFAKAIAALNASVENGWQGVFEPNPSSLNVSPFATPPKAASCAAKLGVTNTPKEARIFE